VPGLYFLGLQWLSKMNSSFLSGVGDDAAVLADHILGRRWFWAVPPPSYPAHAGYPVRRDFSIHHLITAASGV